MTEFFYQGFACPHERLSPGVKDYIVVEHARAVCDEFLQRFSDGIRQRSDGLVEFLSAWLSGPVTFSEVWNLGFGRVRATLRNPHGDAALRAAVELALELQSQGIPGRWSSQIPARARLQWGRHLFDAASSVEVSSEGGRADIMADGSAIALTRTADGWTGGGLVNISHVRLRDHMVRVYRPDSLVCSSFDDVRTRLADESGANGANTALEAAFALLGKASPLYSKWVAGTVYGIIPFARPEGTPYLSGSYVDRPGVMTCSFPAPVEMIAELLVHEASHQYFYILQKLGPVDDGSDDQLYYSPARDQGRPLMFILLAYHAFANILLCLNELVASGFSTAHLLRRQRELQEWVPVLETPLRNNPALSDIGNALWQPIHERLRSSGCDPAGREVPAPNQLSAPAALPG